MHLAYIGPARIPALGLGTYGLSDDQATTMVEAALAEGFRHIDTAQLYDNEVGVGRGIAHSSVPREQVFLTTKIFPEHFAPAAFKTRLDESLVRLGTDYVDLLLLHWPSREVPIADTIGALNELITGGKVRHGGVSNFTIKMVDEARAASATPLAVNQVELHPFIDQRKLIAHLAQHGIPVEAYSPLARGQVMQSPELAEIAAAHQANPAQIALAWILAQLDGIAIPKTATPERLAGNLKAVEIRLSDDEMARIAALARPDGRIISPASLAPEWD